MIKINRGPAPKYFSTSKVDQAKKRLEEHFGAEERQERLRFDSSLLVPIKKELLKMCNSKCAYCESKLGVISDGDIEYFRPKTGARGLNPDEYAPKHYWWLAYEWDNLVIACQICNQKYKRDYFPLESETLRSRIGATGTELLLEQSLLIDPTNEDPSDHIEFAENGYAIELSKKGKVTIEILGLNRTELVENRKNVAERLKDSLETMQSITNLNNRFTKSLLLDIKDLYSESPAQEYVAVQRTVFDSWYEVNSELWENAKKGKNDNSEIFRKQKIDISESSKIAEEINEVNTILTSLKRFSIKTIDIENFKSIEKLTLNLKAMSEKDNKESWLLLLGDNGIGKSSILQAIALALTSKRQLNKLNLNAMDFLRNGADLCKVIIHSHEHDNPITLQITKEGFFTELEEAPTFILGYGSTRLLPKGTIKPDTKREPYSNIRNLFDYSVALNDPNLWLNNIDNQEFNERVAPAFFDILALQGKDRLWINDGKINIQQSGKNHKLEDNSDGYKTIIALVSDIMQTLSIEKANYHNSQGIVLIDEIGNHLHPRWRMKIAGALREAFPKLQFIVTTHEPLCLRGLSHGEVMVLVKDQKNTVRGLDGSLLPDHNLMRIEQLLTSDLFGLLNIVDDEAQKTYEEYYKLLSKKEEDKTQQDIVKLGQLTSMLAEKEMLGNTPREQILYKVIDETFAQKVRDEGFKTTETLKNETISKVKEMLNKTQNDWL